MLNKRFKFLLNILNLYLENLETLIRNKKKNEENFKQFNTIIYINLKVLTPITSVRDRNFTQGANMTLEATVHTDDLVFTGVEACVGHGMFASSTEDGQLC